ncbi:MULTISPECIES: hypothetical protein [unclassified Coleofasciculus]|uniref:hypothetical protein n=1 Tax=unclassified Coleofasciculus TaxID=2692782 RepID=UPI001881D499|nr:MULTISPECIES: hypothetical protein [unclassified Coleofasciculus]MBE9124776.1 hypothetical protein [Coleofasciculus sp. LEGE 07081]MBE9148228.1 hypothetical protein [Coleofasciculus sp. LEGE 07092]
MNAITITSDQIRAAAEQICHSDAPLHPVEDVAVVFRKWLERQIGSFLEDPDFSTQHLDRKFFADALSDSGKAACLDSDLVA